MTMKMERNVHIAALGSGRAPMVPCFPARFSHLSCQPCSWKALGKCGRILPQNGYQTHNSETRNNAKLPFLELPSVSVQPKGLRSQNVCSSKSGNGSVGKYTYFHFSSPVRLAVKPPPCRPRRDFAPGSHNRSLAGHNCSTNPAVQNLMVNGTTCVPSSLPQIRRPKMEIHVYVPNGKENTDAESLDEGFLEETDNRPSTRRTQGPSF